MTTVHKLGGSKFKIVPMRLKGTQAPSFSHTKAIVICLRDALEADKKGLLESEETLYSRAMGLLEEVQKEADDEKLAYLYGAFAQFHRKRRRPGDELTASNFQKDATESAGRVEALDTLLKG